jgi:transposase-like protein
MNSSHRFFYNNKQKLAIIKEAYSKPCNIRATARKYGVEPTQIRRWKKRLSARVECGDELPTKEKFDHHTKAIKTLHPGRTPKNARQYPELKGYFKTLRGMHRVVTVEMLGLELKRLASSNEPLEVICKRIYRWLSNEGIVQRRVTHVGQRTVHDPIVIADFVQYVNSQIICGRYSPYQIVNIDETNVHFDMPGSTTLEERGARTVSVQTTGSSLRVTVLLGVTRGGDKLPPLIIFRDAPGGTVAREWLDNDDFPTSCHYTVQERGWVDETVFCLWIRTIWKGFTAGQNGSYLLLDESFVHVMPKLYYYMFHRLGTEVDYVVPGYTSQLQVLDLGISKPFKGL